MEFKLVPMNKKEIESEEMQEYIKKSTTHGGGPYFWFGQGKEVGAELVYDGFIESTKLVNILENLHNKHILKSLYASEYSPRHVF
jgi:hypothetical protein